jgi:hydroxymethylbilane synthase
VTAPVRVGTRRSLLARTQTETVVAALRSRWPGVSFETVLLDTSGDRTPAGGSPDFTDALDRGVRSGRLDFAVHSAKDLAARLAPGLRLVACPPRLDPRDALVGPGVTSRRGPPRGATVGSSSPRRRAELLRWRPDLKVVELRGNVDSRLRRLDSGEIDAAILAVAGLERLGRAQEIGRVLELSTFLPAPGQGALALVARPGDRRMARILAAADHGATRRCVLAEREVIARLGGDCEAPLGALATERRGRIEVSAEALSHDGRRSVRVDAHGPAATAPSVGAAVARRLLAAGAQDLWEP